MSVLRRKKSLHACTHTVSMNILGNKHKFKTILRGL